MTERYCPAWGPGSPVCPRSICDCFIDQFPDDMEAAGALHPEFFTVIPPGTAELREYYDTTDTSTELERATRAEDEGAQ